MIYPLNKQNRPDRIRYCDFCHDTYYASIDFGDDCNVALCAHHIGFARHFGKREISELCIVDENQVHRFMLLRGDNGRGRIERISSDGVWFGEPGIGFN